MATLEQNLSGAAELRSGTIAVPRKSKALEHFYEKAEASRLVVFPTILAAILCLSGIAAGFGAKGDTIKLLVMLIPNCLSLTFTLGIAPVRWVMAAFAATVIADLIVLAI